MIKPYLMFNKNCEEAMEMYRKAFNGEIVAMQRYGEMPPNPEFPIPEDAKNLVLHTQLKLTEGGYIMGCDSLEPLANGDNLCISVELKSEEVAKNAWNVLKEGATIFMDLNPEFFAKLHGSLKDKFGFVWMFTVE